MIRCQITNGQARHDEDAWLRSLFPEADLIQIREPDLTTRQLAELVRRVLAMKLRAKILVNDRLDVALATGAAGVHLKSAGLAPEAARTITPEAFLVTVACHNEADVLSSKGADYALLAPIFSPLSKTDTRVPLGLTEFKRIAMISPTPILALGGITAANATLCVEAGAAGIAGISLFR